MVLFFTVPVRVCAEAETRSSVDSNTVHCNSRTSPHFSQNRRETGYPVFCLRVLRHVVSGKNLKLWLLFGCAVAGWPRLLPGAQFQPALPPLLLRERFS